MGERDSGGPDREKAGSMLIREDNQSAICMATNPVFHARTKHVDLKYHFVRDHVEKKTIVLEYCPTENMTADILTKNLQAPWFVKLREQLGVTRVEN